MGSEEEEVFRGGVGGFAEEGTQLGGNWMNRKSNRRLRAGNLLSWGMSVLPLWSKRAQRQAAAADSGAPRSGRERLMIVQGHLWPPAPCRCETALICSQGRCLGSSRGSVAPLQGSVKQRRFSRVVIKQSQKYICDIQPSCTGHLRKTQP